MSVKKKKLYGPKKGVQEVFFLNVNSVINFRRVTHFRLCLLETQVELDREEIDGKLILYDSEQNREFL